MPKITYDFAAQHALDAIVAANPARWMFEVNPNPPWQFRQNMNGYFIGQQIGMSTDFYGWHDTCTALGQGCIMRNLAFRTNQYGPCFDYNLCNTTAYNRFKSCETALNEIGSGSTCSYAFVYLGTLLSDSVTKIACSVLEVPGWSPPPGQLNSYWCFTDGAPPISDRPYQPKLKI